MRLSVLAILLLLTSSALAATTANSAGTPKDLSTVRGFNFTPTAADVDEAFWLNYPAAEIDRDFGYAQ